MLDHSPLTNPTVLPLRKITAIAAGSALVVAPHPDDETLGCGGAIALLRSLNCAVQVLVISDGTMSHPNSVKYPATVLRALREAETRSALSILGVEAAAITFLRLQDGAISTLESSDIRSAIASCRTSLAEFAPKTIFLPWRHDPHSDHRATWNLIHSALGYLPLSPRLIEYPIWDWDSDQRGSLPETECVTAWRLDISEVLELKQKAIAAYRSQTTNLIDDDPQCFRLTPQMLTNFSHPWELYLEESNEPVPKTILTTELF
jgi:LmbE family N-acetylglucosaminyl deacetylase